MDTNEFQQLLEEMRKRVVEELEALRTEMDAISTEDEIDDNADMAQLMSDGMDHHAQIARLERELVEIHHAMEKIAHGSYGICEATGKAIPVERLRAEPTARTIVEK